MELRSGSVVGLTPASPAWPSMTQEGISMFGEGIRMCFSRWTAMQLAVDNEWGGRSSRQKSTQLESDILLWFVQSRENDRGGRSSSQIALQLQTRDLDSPFLSSEGLEKYVDTPFQFVQRDLPRYIDELEQLLDDNMLELFNMQTEDDSIQEVAEQLMILHEECAQGKYDTVRRLASAGQSRPAVHQSQKVVNENGDGEDSDDDLIGGQEHDLSTSLGLQGTDMDVDSSPARTRSVVPREDNVHTLTEEEMADGWQAAPTRSRRRGGQRT